MASPDDALLDAWRICNRVTTLLVASLPDALWPLALSGAPRRSVRNVAVHLHNCRGLWLKSLGRGAGIALPAKLDPKSATRARTVVALARSGEAILRLLRAGIANGGDFPGVASAFHYGAMPRNAVLFCAYAVSHEAHHRGQLLVMARQLGHRLPPEVVAGLWQWSSRLREAGGG
jgi:uncharacterized damage-inducible protein DinB